MSETQFEQLTRTLTYSDPRPHMGKLLGLSGLEQFEAMRDGVVPTAPIGSHLGMGFESITVGDVVFTGEPDVSHYNPIGVVHGGFAATLLDSVCGCAVHTTLPAGSAYTSLEIKVNFIKAITADTGTITAHGWVTKAGRKAAFAEGDLRDAQGNLYATASSTCLIFPLPT